MDWMEEALALCIKKTERNIAGVGERFPHVALEGKYNDEGPYFWTSGFWAGILWLCYEETKNEKARELAIKLEEKLDEPLDDFLRLHHDVGFMWMPTAVTHYRSDRNQFSRKRGLKAASHLAGRFNPAGNFIRAWTDEVNPDSTGWAIIDCMMNLPLLYWASGELGDPRFKNIAIAHTNTVLHQFLRQDNTVPHIVSFDPVTGEKIENLGGQGLGPDSVWARGQAWAIYGFAIAGRETGRKIYLDAARNIANFFLAHLPAHKAPCWDFYTPDTGAYAKDTSAAACAASGMLELSNILEDQAEKKFYRQQAGEILKGLYDNYSDLDSQNQSFLTHGTVSYPNNKHINVPIIYGDYFFLEGLRKLQDKKGIF